MAYQCICTNLTRVFTEEYDRATILFNAIISYDIQCVTKISIMVGKVIPTAPGELFPQVHHP